METSKNLMIEPRHVWSVLCRRSVVDQQSNNLSLFDTFEQIGIETSDLPSTGAVLAAPIEFELVSLWEIENAGAIEKSAKIELIDPIGKELLSVPRKLEFSPGKKRMRFITKFGSLPFSVPGVYRVRIRLSEHEGHNRLISDTPLEVNITRKT